MDKLLSEQFLGNELIIFVIDLHLVRQREIRKICLLLQNIPNGIFQIFFSVFISPEGDFQIYTGSPENLTFDAPLCKKKMKGKQLPGTDPREDGIFDF